MTDRNLPPGCSSADGGIDHALEASLEDLCDDVTDSSEADALRKLLPAVREILKGARDDGRFEAVSLDARASTLLAAVLHWAKGEIIIAPHELAEIDVNAHVEITHEETGALRLRLGPRS